MQIYTYVHTRGRDSHPGFDGVKIKLLLLLLLNKIRKTENTLIVMCANKI